MSPETFVKQQVSSDFIFATYSFGIQFISSCLTALATSLKQVLNFRSVSAFPLWWVFLLSSFPEDFPWQGNREDAVTFKVTFRSKERRVQNKHTFNFFAALAGLRENRRQDLEQELHP